MNVCQILGGSLTIKCEDGTQIIYLTYSLPFWSVIDEEEAAAAV